MFNFGRLYYISGLVQFEIILDSNRKPNQTKFKTPETIPDPELQFNLIRFENEGNILILK